MLNSAHRGRLGDLWDVCTHLNLCWIFWVNSKIKVLICYQSWNVNFCPVVVLRVYRFWSVYHQAVSTECYSFDQIASVLNFDLPWNDFAFECTEADLSNIKWSHSDPVVNQMNRLLHIIEARYVWVTMMRKFATGLLNITVNSNSVHQL